MLIKKSRIFKVLTVSLMLVFCMFIYLNDCTAEEKALPQVNWKMTSAVGQGTVMWEANKLVPKMVEEMTNGKFKITLFAPGAIVPGMEAFNAVQNGTVECAQGFGCYWVGKNTAFGAINSLCNGMNPWDLLSWYYQGGGEEIAQDIYSEFGIKYFMDWGHGPEQGFLTNTPIRTLEDFKGLKLRVSGQISREVVERLGASAVMLSGGEVYNAMKRGIIDGVEMATPYVNWQMNMQDCAKYWSVPVWHQRSGLHGLLVNEEAYNNLPKEYQKILEYACQASAIEGILMQDYTGAEGANKFIEDGIEKVELNEELLAEIQKIALEVKKEFAEENEDFARVLESQQEYLNYYKEWREAQGNKVFGETPALFEAP